MNGDPNTIPFHGDVRSIHAMPLVPSASCSSTNDDFRFLDWSPSQVRGVAPELSFSGDPNNIPFHRDVWSIHAMPLVPSASASCSSTNDDFGFLDWSPSQVWGVQPELSCSGDPNTIPFHGDVWSIHAMPLVPSASASCSSTNNDFGFLDWSPSQVRGVAPELSCSGDAAPKMPTTNCFPELAVSSGNMTSAQYLQLQRLFSNDLYWQSNQTTYQTFHNLRCVPQENHACGTCRCSCNCGGLSSSPPSRRSVILGDSWRPGGKRNPFRLGLDRVDKNPEDDKDKEECELFRRLQNQEKYTSLEQVKGWMVAIAKTQTGSKFLKERCNIPEELETIFVEVKDRICELTKDPFGNDLVRCLLKSCNSTKRTELVSNLTWRKDQLFDLSLHVYGTRIVQELVDAIKTEEEISLVRAALRPRVVILMKDDNGNHVVKRWLAKFKDGEAADANNFLVDAVVRECFGIANHRQGHAIVKACLDCTKGKPKEKLINAIISNTPCLSEGQYGNYVVQHLLNQEVPWIKENVVTVLKGQFVSLSQHMFGSNVVESCMKFGGEKETTEIIIELLKSPHFLVVLNDRYGNYVAQTALECSKGYAVHDYLLNCVLANKDILSDCKYGKNVLSKVRKLPLSAGKCCSRRQICRKLINKKGRKKVA